MCALVYALPSLLAAPGAASPPAESRRSMTPATPNSWVAAGLAFTRALLRCRALHFHVEATALPL